MHRLKKLVAVILCILVITSICVIGSSVTAGASGTGAGLAEWALNAYYSGWSYSWGGASPGAVDCSGLIYSYCGGERIAMIETCTEQGSVDAGIPRVHGLGLWRPGHVGVYIENNMEVDARGDEWGVCYDEIGGWNNWTYWFKLAAVNYPTNGWEKFNGNYYYYENGQYIVSTSRTIDCTTYYFDGNGHSSTTPSNMDSTASDSPSSDSSDSSDSSSSSSAPTTWSNGSSGEEVEKIQTRLQELGFYSGPIDGEFGNATEQAYRAFQEAAGVTVDGIAGSDRDILYSDDAPHAKKAETEEATAPTEEATVPEETVPEETAPVIIAQNGDFSEEVITIQQKLLDLGYFGIQPTGFYGDLTEEAIKAFQTQNGLEATGILDSETYALLFSEKAAANPTPVVNVEEQQEVAVSAGSGPSQITSGDLTPTSLVVSNDTNQTYANTASNVADKTNKVTEQALASSASVIPSFAAQVKRTANVWIWFVLVAVILGAVSLIMLKRDKKHNTRYQKYLAKKQKAASTRAQLNTRW
jgi:peptidoglycan hydrolase-like protein with peptidoglycan-binding domain